MLEPRRHRASLGVKRVLRGLSSFTEMVRMKLKKPRTASPPQCHGAQFFALQEKKTFPRVDCDFVLLCCKNRLCCCPQRNSRIPRQIVRRTGPANRPCPWQGPGPALGPAQGPGHDRYGIDTVPIFYSRIIDRSMISISIDRHLYSISLLYQ